LPLRGRRPLIRRVVAFNLPEQTTPDAAVLGMSFAVDAMLTGQLRRVQASGHLICKMTTSRLMQN
jgi:hypothetical protein